MNRLENKESAPEVTCEEVQNCLKSLLTREDDFSPAEWERIRRFNDHIEECPDCKKLFDEVMQVEGDDDVTEEDILSSGSVAVEIRPAFIEAPDFETVWPEVKKILSNN